MTYVIFQPPAHRPMLTTNSRLVAQRWARAFPHVHVMGVDAGIAGHAYFSRGRRVGVGARPPDDVGRAYLAHIKRAHGVVELPAMSWGLLLTNAWRAKRAGYTEAA